MTREQKHVIAFSSELAFPCMTDDMIRRVRQSVAQFKAGQISLVALWNSSVTNLFDLLTNLGRAAARISAEEGDSAARARLTAAGGSAAWVPAIEKRFGELRTLRSKQYKDWSLEPFAGIEDASEPKISTILVNQRSTRSSARVVRTLIHNRSA